MENQQKQIKEEDLMHDFSQSNMGNFMITKKLLILLTVLALLGVSTGFLLAKTGIQVPGYSGGSTAKNGAALKGKTFGSNDTKTFKDQAEGILKDGGIDGEGQFHLVRPGGDSQNVYLTSSLLDLSLFKKRKIRVWGETQAAQKAGWLMDVGRVQVLE